MPAAQEAQGVAEEPPSIALYVASALVQVSGLAAVCFQVDAASFTFFTIGLTIVGTIASYFLRRKGARSDLLKWGAVALALVFVGAVRRTPLFEPLISSERSISQEIVLVCALAITATFGSFLLVTDDALIFTCIWSIAMIGLTGTVNVNSELPICFAAFLLSAAFLLVHQNALRIRRSATTVSVASEPEAAGTRQTSFAPFGTGNRWRLLRAEFVVALAAWGIALILGTLVAIPVQMIGRNMSLNAILRQLHAPVGINAHLGPAHLVFNDLRDFTVGLGPVDSDPNPHLVVLSEKPHYWRGRTYDFYNGHGWSNQDEFGRKSLSPISSQQDTRGFNTFVIQPASPIAALPTESVKITTDFHSIGTFTSPFYGAAEPILLRAPVAEVGVHFDRTIGTQLQQSGDYQIVSAFYTPRAGELRRSGSNYPAAIIGRYLVTNRIADSVRTLAQETVGGITENPYDRASALKRFIGSRCVYNQNARAVPRDRDAVDFFLNDSREGYCDLYASAMVTMCRSVGIPARVATGYAPGVLVTGETTGDIPQKAPSDRRNQYLLRGDDLHAWAEVYFVNYGWVVFDPTQDTAGGLSGVPLATTAEKSKEPPWRRFAAVAFMLGLLAALAATANEIRLRLHPSAYANPFRARSARAVSRSYRDAVRLLARKGARRTVAMTGSEYVALIEDRFGPNAARALRSLTAQEERLLYSDPTAPMTDADASAEALQARAALRDLRQSLKNRRSSLPPHATKGAA